MYKQASLSIAKIAVLASLLFISSTAYAHEEQAKVTGTWKHGLGIKQAAISSGNVGAFTYPGSNLTIFEYSPTYDFPKWSIQFNLGAGVILDHDISRSDNITPASGLDFGFGYSGITVLSKVNSRFSLGLSNLYTSTSIHTRDVQYSTSGSEWGFALSFHDQTRKHAFELSLGEDASTIGYRWGWTRK